MLKTRWTRRRFIHVSSLIAFVGPAMVACAQTPPTPTAAPTPAGAGGPSPGSPTPATAASPTTAPAAAPASSSGKVDLAQWYHQYGEKGTEQAVLRFAQEYGQANPNVKVTVTWVPGDYGSKLAAALASGQGPDVYETMPTVAMVKAKQCAPLDDILTDVKSDFNPKDLQAATINGKVYAVKMIDDTGTLYYRKSALDKASVQPPKTFDELREVAKKLTSRQQKGLFIGNDGGISSMLTLAPISAGATIIDDKGIEFNTQMTVEAYENIAKLNKDGSLLIGSPTDWWDPSAFIQGLTAMQWGGLWAYPAIHDALKDDFGVMPWPEMKTSVSDAKPTPVTFWGGWGELANAQSKHLDEAKALIKWLWIDNTKIQIEWATAYGFHVPPRLSVAKQADKIKSGLPNQIVQDMYQYGVILPPTWDAAMGTILTTAFSNIVKLGRDAKTEVANAAKAADAELKSELS